ncbi:hypothetical protein Adt_01510 [Abeliophyllum distichum]|uniref:Uncharacterized protein n=1 Tax=Abeliophyllum distichum TaxID=126358 RepID=A0ABD1VTE5_9LAMI
MAYNGLVVLAAIMPVGIMMIGAEELATSTVNPVKPTFLRQLEHRFTSRFTGTASTEYKSSFFKSLLVSTGFNFLSDEDLEDELDLNDFLDPIATATTENVDLAAMALKHVLHESLAAELPAMPHLTHSVMVSVTTLNFVSSFYVFCAIITKTIHKESANNTSNS